MAWTIVAIVSSPRRRRFLSANTWSQIGSGSGCGSLAHALARPRASSCVYLRAQLVHLRARAGACAPRASSRTRRGSRPRPSTKFAPRADEWPCRRDTIASSRYGLRSVRTYSIAFLQREVASPRDRCRRSSRSACRTPCRGRRCCSSPCWPSYGVEMPYWLFVTIISSGSSLPLRELHTRHGREIALGRAGVAALHDGDALRAAAAALRQRGAGAIEYCTSIGEVTGDDVPLAHRVVAGEVAAARVRVGRRVLHLPQRVDRVRAHREQRAARRGSAGAGSRGRRPCPCRRAGRAGR